MFVPGNVLLDDDAAIALALGEQKSGLDIFAVAQIQ